MPRCSGFSEPDRENDWTWPVHGLGTRPRWDLRLVRLALAHPRTWSAGARRLPTCCTCLRGRASSWRQVRRRVEGPDPCRPARRIAVRASAQIRQYVRVSAIVRAPDGVTIREQGAGDATLVHDLIATAFRDRMVADLDAALAQRAGGTAYVAATTRVLVGHVRLTWGWLDAPARLVEVLVLSPLSVAPLWQRRGVGRALVARAVAGATDLDSPLVFLEGDPGYYSGCGFEPAVRFGFSPPSVRIPEPGFQVIRLPGYEPWMTGALVYPDTFWEFDRVGLRE